MNAWLPTNQKRCANPFCYITANVGLNTANTYFIKLYIGILNNTCNINRNTNTNNTNNTYYTDNYNNKKIKYK